MSFHAASDLCAWRAWIQCLFIIACPGTSLPPSSPWSQPLVQLLWWGFPPCNLAGPVFGILGLLLVGEGSWVLWTLLPSPRLPGKENWNKRSISLESRTDYGKGPRFHAAFPFSPSPFSNLTSGPEFIQTLWRISWPFFQCWVSLWC